MIIQADILKWAEEYDGPLFHALLCDPPYHLTELPRVSHTGKFGGPRDDDARARRGFMGKQWDGGDIAFRPETWATIARVLHPGAFGMAFASSRGWHRMAVAIEDAGLIIHPVILAWGYGSGFPKATRLDTQIDRRAGAARETIGTSNGAASSGSVLQTGLAQTYPTTQPATELAQAWQGHRYGGQAMKPAIEPIIVFQKPYAGRPVDSITRTGAGALWIDGARIGTDEETMRHARAETGMLGSEYQRQVGYRPKWKRDDYDRTNGGHEAGRWPANLILSHSPACNGECAPGCPVAALGAQSGETTGGGIVKSRLGENGYGGGWGEYAVDGPADSGTAARFFFQADYMAERLEAADAVQYQAKASRAEREAGLDPRTVALMRALDDGDVEEFEGRAVYGKMQTIRRCSEHGASIGKGAYSCGCALEYGFPEDTIDDGRQKPIDNPYQRGKTVRRNTHPTIKPIALARYLATLLLPPAEYAPRRLLIPFSGAGSEIIGADLAGWEEVVGVELEADHVKIAEARRAYWQQRRWELGDPARPITAKTADAPDGQLDMFLED